jgi:hypothetical protein
MAGSSWFEPSFGSVVDICGVGGLTGFVTWEFWDSSYRHLIFHLKYRFS